MCSHSRLGHWPKWGQCSTFYLYLASILLLKADSGLMRLCSPSLPGFPRLGLVPAALRQIDLILFLLLPGSVSPAASVPPASASVFSSLRGIAFCLVGS